MQSLTEPHNTSPPAQRALFHGNDESDQEDASKSNGKDSEMQANLGGSNAEPRPEEQAVDGSDMLAELERKFSKEEAQRGDNKSESAQMSKAGGTEQQVPAAERNQDNQEDGQQQSWPGQ